MGVPVIDTDRLARDLTQPHQSALASIIKHFGREICLPDGTLNRAKLRDIIFSTPKERLWLENLLHPLIQKAMEAEISTLTAPYCLVVIPLLFEVEFYACINRILVVDAPTHVQIERIMVRDNTSKSKVEAILKSQASRESRVARAQDLITNEGSLDDLMPEVATLHQFYLKLSKAENGDNLVN